EHDKLPEAAYSPAVTARVYATIADKARRALAAGHSAVVDAVFARPQERAVTAASAEVLDVPFHGLFLAADLATRIARASGRGGPPPGDLRSGRARLEAHRCLRHAGGNLRPRASGDGAMRMADHAADKSDRRGGDVTICGAETIR